MAGCQGGVRLASDDGSIAATGGRLQYGLAPNDRLSHKADALSSAASRQVSDLNPTLPSIVIAPTNRRPE